VGVALLAPPNIAVRVLGRARLVKERMDTGELLAILEIGIEEAKNDMMRWSSIESAFGFAPPADLEDYYVGAIAKLEDM
jgi:hypothetical protein